MPCQCSPCSEVTANTAENETLSSQIDNFTLQFFGTVVKTEVDGVVSWSLPCSLDTGLENNPRADGEGLACYFLRLFQYGITGATGPQGATGADGADGNNAYSVVLSSFTHPSLASPNIVVVGAANPAILEGLYVFIQTSGWYLVSSVSGGTFNLTLSKEIDSPATTINAGKLIIPAGYPGASVTGPQGPKGDKGDTGDTASAFTATNGQYSVALGTDFNLQVLFDPVDFTSSAPELLLPDQGTYLVSAVIDVQGLAGVALSDIVSVKLFNTTDNADVEGSDHAISNLVADQLSQIVISCLVYTDGDNKTISLYGKCTTADKVAVLALTTTLTYVRLS